MRCIFCGERFEEGYPPRLLGNFTAQQWLQAGDGICPRCHGFLKTPEARRTSWLIRGPEMRVDLLEPLERPLETLLNPPETPFRLYLTRQRRKHGWIRLLRCPALSRRRFPVAFEEELIIVELERAWRMHRLCSELRGKGISKSGLLRGLSAGEARCGGLSHGLIREVERLRSDPLWEVIVSFGA